MNRMRRQHSRTRVRNSTERNLVLALGELERLAGRMGLPTSVREEVCLHLSQGGRSQVGSWS